MSRASRRCSFRTASAIWTSIWDIRPIGKPFGMFDSGSPLAKKTIARKVPRALDPYLGKTRVERARAFEQALRSLRVDSHLAIFPNAGHEVTADMRKSALQFLQNDELADHWDD
jgi:hypothetical protein